MDGAIAFFEAQPEVQGVAFFDGFLYVVYEPGIGVLGHLETLKQQLIDSGNSWGHHVEFDEGDDGTREAWLEMPNSFKIW
jgi:hypothetical protein